MSEPFWTRCTSARCASIAGIEHCATVSCFILLTSAVCIRCSSAMLGQVISKEVYRQVAERAVDKILLSHANEPDASFLVTEAGSVQRLVTGYIQHVQERKP